MVDLLKMEREAMDLRAQGMLREAATAFEAIVRISPDWEHGGAQYNLACCYEDIGEVLKAEESFQIALRYSPNSVIFLGGYSSFLFQHGDPTKALKEYVRLLHMARHEGNSNMVQRALAAIRMLGRKLGLSEESVSRQIDSS